MTRRSFGLVRKLPSGRWQASYHHPKFGKRVNASSTFQSKGDANAWLAAQETGLRGGGPVVDPSRARTRFEGYSSAWLSERPLRDRTRSVYESILNVDVLPTFGDVRLDGTILTTAVEDGVLGDNPCRVRGAATERADERTIPTLGEVEAILTFIEPRYRAAVVLAAFCGLRKGECFGLARRHVTIGEVQSSVRVERTRHEVTGKGLVFEPPKTDAGARVVSLPERVRSELIVHLRDFVPDDPEALLFADEKSGDVPRASKWKRIWGLARNNAGVPNLTFHDLRHLAGTLTALAGGTLKEIQARLGHSSPDAAMIYQHVAQGRDDVLASAIDRLVSSN